MFNLVLLNMYLLSSVDYVFTRRTKIVEVFKWRGKKENRRKKIEEKNKNRYDCAGFKWILQFSNGPWNIKSYT